MPRQSVTTPEQRALARAYAREYGIKYSSALRTFQRRQTNATQKRGANEATNRRIIEVAGTTPIEQYSALIGVAPPSKKRLEGGADIGEPDREPARGVVLRLKVPNEIEGKDRKFEYGRYKSRSDAINAAYSVYNGESNYPWLDIRAKLIVVEYFKKGDHFYKRRRKTKFDSRTRVRETIDADPGEYIVNVTGPLDAPADSDISNILEERRGAFDYIGVNDDSDDPQLSFFDDDEEYY